MDSNEINRHMLETEYASYYQILTEERGLSLDLPQPHEIGDVDARTLARLVAHLKSLSRTPK